MIDINIQVGEYYLSIAFQNFLCPSQCICKGHVIYCHLTGVNMSSIPTNTTLLYLSHVEVYNTQGDDHVQQAEHSYPNLTLVNITDSQIAPQVLYEFLLFLPNLRVLLMHNASLIELRWNFFMRLHKMQILELQRNNISILTSGCFLGCSEVTSLDLHGMFIRIIQSKSFDGMASLQLLNLSYNRLEHLSDDIMQTMYALSIIDLRGNKFKRIHSHTFYGLDATIYTTSSQLCCFVPPTSTCYATDLR